MSDNLVKYLKREHDRLERELAEAQKHPAPDTMLIARLKKLKLAVKDQMFRHAPSSDLQQAA